MAGGGKSTFLAALPRAPAYAETKLRWALSGSDSASRTYLADIQRRLRQDLRFPVGTLQKTLLRFILKGQARGPSGAVTSVRLSVADRPGQEFAPSLGLQTADEIATAFQGCRGLVYLFDPVVEKKLVYGPADASGKIKLGNTGYFSEVVQELWAKVEEDGKLDGATLPHRLAVCVAKFDDPTVYQVAQEQGYLSWPNGPNKAPRIDSPTAREFFEYLCEHTPGSPQLAEIPNYIEQYFAEDRVSYFVSSSIGLHQPGGNFILDDWLNIVPNTEHVPKLRHAIRPMNVLEPVLAAAGQSPGSGGR